MSSRPEGRNVKTLIYRLKHPRRALAPAKAFVGRLLDRPRSLIGGGPGSWQLPQARDRGDSAGDRVLPVDPNLPQLEVAGDSGLMQEVFEGHLRSLDGKTYPIRECRIFHTRYRQGARCVVHYALSFEEPDTGRWLKQRVTGVMFAGRQTRRIWKKLRRSDSGRGIPGAPPALEPFSYIPDLDMLVQVFPYDYELPALPLLMAGPTPELGSLLLARFGPGDWREEVWDIEPIRYQAGSRATLRLTGRARDSVTDRTEERRFYAKIYQAEEKGEQTYQVMRALWDKASAGGEGFTVGRPIAYLSDLRTLVQEEAPGATLRDVLIREDEATPAVRRAARALATLHLDHLPTPQHRHLQDQIYDLEKRVELLRRACPHLGPEIEEVAGAVVAGLEEGPLAPTHCDLSLGHILLDGDRLSLLDLDAFAEADPILDVANVLSQLAVMPLMIRRSLLSEERARTAARIFVEEYFACVPKTWRDRLPPRYAFALLKRATGMYKSQTPDWPNKIEGLITEAKDALAGRIW